MYQSISDNLLRQIVTCVAGSSISTYGLVRDAYTRYVMEAFERKDRVMTIFIYPYEITMKTSISSSLTLCEPNADMYSLWGEEVKRNRIKLYVDLVDEFSMNLSDIDTPEKVEIQLTESQHKRTLNELSMVRSILKI